MRAAQNSHLGTTRYTGEEKSGLLPSERTPDEALGCLIRSLRDKGLVQAY